MANTRLYEKWTWNIGLPEPVKQMLPKRLLQDWDFLICPRPVLQIRKSMIFLGRCFRKMKRITPA